MTHVKPLNLYHVDSRGTLVKVGDTVAFAYGYYKHVFLGEVAGLTPKRISVREIFKDGSKSNSTISRESSQVMIVNNVPEPAGEGRVSEPAYVSAKQGDRFPVDRWLAEVSMRNTELGYNNWVRKQLQEEYDAINN